MGDVAVAIVLIEVALTGLVRLVYRGACLAVVHVCYIRHLELPARDGAVVVVQCIASTEGACELHVRLAERLGLACYAVHVIIAHCQAVQGGLTRRRSCGAVGAREAVKRVIFILVGHGGLQKTCAAACAAAAA